MSTAEKEPEMAEIGPIWWISHGTKMKLDKNESSKEVLVLKGSAAEVRITKAPGEESGWFIEYRIDHGGGCQTNGRVWMTDSELGAAFGLVEDVERNSSWMIERFGGTVAKQRKFIRYRDFLNIPGPGSGYQGDPNVSIELYPETKLAIHNLVLLDPADRR